MKIITCTCSHEYQDKTYGKQKRAMNPTKDPKTYRCTVCNRNHATGKDVEAPAVAK